MAMAIDMTHGYHYNELNFPAHSTTTTSSDACDWEDWSPMVDWGSLSCHQNDFLDLMDAMIDGGTQEPTPCNSTSSVEYTNISNNSCDSDTTMLAEEETASGEDCKGLRLVHLLMGAAEALTGANKSHELARVILVRLKEMVSPVEGTNMERLATYFTDALHGLLEGSSVNGKHSVNHHRDEHSQMDVLAAFQLLQDMSPYVKFGHFTANQAILEAVSHERRIHIVDFDIMEGIQWASLMQALVSKKEGPTGPHLRITAVSRSGGNGRRPLGTVQETGRRLVNFAASIGQPFSFQQCRLDSDEIFRPSSLKLVRGEALIMNCMLHLPHFSHRGPDSVTSFLSASKELNPKLVTLVEEEVGPLGPEGGFVGRFMDSMHHYSAMYDSLEAGFPMQGRARALVEKVFLGPRIASSLAWIYRTRESEEISSWWEWLCGEGFRPASISFANHCQAKLLLGLYNDGYRVEELARNRLVLGWKSRRLLSASIWTGPCNNYSDSD